MWAGYDVEWVLWRHRTDRRRRSVFMDLDGREWQGNKKKKSRKSNKERRRFRFPPNSTTEWNYGNDSLSLAQLADSGSMLRTRHEEEEKRSKSKFSSFFIVNPLSLLVYPTRMMRLQIFANLLYNNLQEREAARAKKILPPKLDESMCKCWWEAATVAHLTTICHNCWQQQEEKTTCTASWSCTCWK